MFGRRWPDHCLSILAVKVANLKAAGQFDIIHFDWLLDCIKREIIANLEPRYMIYTKPETQEKFKNEIDVYGDSFATDTTPELLQQVQRHYVPLRLTVSSYFVQRFKSYFLLCTRS
jgi:hypothetical protein